MLSYLSSLLFFFCLEIALNNGTPQFTNCPSSVCLSQPVSYECIVNTTDGADTLRWRVLNTTNNPITGAVPYAVNQPLTMSVLTSDFTATLTDSSGPIVSNVTFTPRLNISNYTVECEARGTGSYTPVTCPILIAGVPSAPDPNDPNFTTNTLNFSWSPSNSTCVSHYSVNVTSIEYTINTTNTSLSLPVPSTNDTDYFISVVAVDTDGRYMDPVGEKTYVADIPEFVTDLMLNQTGFSINISWDEPPPLMFLPVLSYTLHHNVTSDGSITIFAPDTSYIIRSSVAAGSVYTVGVQASNALGTGPIASAAIRINNLHASTAAVTITYTTNLIATSKSTFSSVAISSTRITLPTPTSTCTPTTKQFGNTVSALAISFPITVILSVIISSVLSSLITYCCCVSRSVKSYSVTAPSTAAADYEIPMKTSSLEVKDNMAYGHVSVGNRSTSGTTPTVYETVQS